MLSVQRRLAPGGHRRWGPRGQCQGLPGTPAQTPGSRPPPPRRDRWCSAERVLGRAGQSRIRRESASHKQPIGDLGRAVALRQGANRSARGGATGEARGTGPRSPRPAGPPPPSPSREPVSRRSCPGEGSGADGSGRSPMAVRAAETMTTGSEPALILSLRSLPAVSRAQSATEVKLPPVA